VGDGALGFWAAVRDVWAKTREQRDWFHKLGNILDKLPKRLQPRVKAALHEMMYAETRDQAREAAQRFATEYGPKYPKAVTTLEKDADVLLTFFDFRAEHWKHLRTSNVIESPFATVRLRQRVTKGAGSRTKGLLMAYKLLDMAQALWRRLDGLTSCRSSEPASFSSTGRSSHARAARRERGPRDGQVLRISPHLTFRRFVEALEGKYSHGDMARVRCRRARTGRSRPLAALSVWRRAGFSRYRAKRRRPAFIPCAPSCRTTACLF
jgi:hypothetical protein